MLQPEDIIPSFLDELEKIAGSFGRWRFPSARTGKRPVSVRKLLELDKAGKLFKMKHTFDKPRLKKQAEGNYTGLVEPKRLTEDPRARKKYEAPTRTDVGDSPARVVGT